MQFVRGNLMVCSGQFYPVDPTSSAAPATVVATLNYTNISGTRSEDIVTLTLGADGVTWSGSWDSTNAGAGTVDWKLQTSNGLQAAAQGSFDILANRANHG
jgi:hypothetical protein